MKFFYHFMRAKPKKDNRAHKGVVRMDDFWFLVSEHFMANRVQFMNECVNGMDRLFALFGWDSVCFFSSPREEVPVHASSFAIKKSFMTIFGAFPNDGRTINDDANQETFRWQPLSLDATRTIWTMCPRLTKKNILYFKIRTNVV